MGSPVQLASATALGSTSERTLYVKCDITLAENIREQLLQRGDNAPLVFKMLKHKLDPGRMVLVTWTSSAEKQAAQLLLARVEGPLFEATSQNLVRISWYIIP